MNQEMLNEEGKSKESKRGTLAAEKLILPRRLWVMGAGKLP